MYNYLYENSTGNILTPKSKKVIYFSYEDFIKSIVNGQACFICGATPESKVFNDEHVIPNWIIKRYCTEKSHIVLHNNQKVFHTKYKIPCCKECNSELGIKIEEPISAFLSRNYNEVINDLENDGKMYHKIFRWMCLIFFKTHYHDCFVRMKQDRRIPSGQIADEYCWHQLYHIHSIARQHFTNAQVSNNVYGSIFLLEALQDFPNDHFDYIDNLNSQTMMMRLGNIVIFAVLNDSRFCLSLYKDFLLNITGTINTVQIYEIFARLRYANQNIKERPKYYTEIHRKKGYRIKAKIPKTIEILQGEDQTVNLFKMMRLYVGMLLHDNFPNKNQFLLDLEEGRAQFVFDNELKFMQQKSYNDKK